MTAQTKSAKPMVAQDLTLADLSKSLAAGWSDFRTHPVFGLFFAGIYVAAGLGLYFGANALGEPVWLFPIIAGFPIVAPFIAVGLYEVSRRREQDLPMEWKPILGALNGRGDEQVILMGGFVFVVFSFWVIIAHTISLIFLPNAGMGGDTLQTLLSPSGLTMLGIGSVVGGLLAWGLFSITVISLPMLIDRDVDCITAIIASVKTVRENLFVMLVWGAIVVVTLMIAMAPALLGLFVVLPVLGHATWHLYRRAVSLPMDDA